MNEGNIDVCHYATRALRGESITVELARACMQELVKGNCSSLAMDQFFRAHRERAVTVEGLIGFVSAFRELRTAEIFCPDALDVCGTGGTHFKIKPNTSSVVAMILACSGVPVAKFGNVGSRVESGSTDFFRSLKCNVEREATELEILYSDLGFAYVPFHLFYPVNDTLRTRRRGFGKRSAFNLIGPLVSPVRGLSQKVIGVSSWKDLQLLGRVVQELMKIDADMPKIVYLVLGELDEGSIDEFSPWGNTVVHRVTRDGKASQVITRQDFKLTKRSFSHDLDCGLAKYNAHRFSTLIRQQRTSEMMLPLLEWYAANAGGILYLLGKAHSPHVGFEMARDAIVSGRVERLITAYRNHTFSN